MGVRSRFLLHNNKNWTRLRGVTIGQAGRKTRGVARPFWALTDGIVLRRRYVLGICRALDCQLIYCLSLWTILRTDHSFRVP